MSPRVEPEGDVNANPCLRETFAAIPLGELGFALGRVAPAAAARGLEAHHVAGREREAVDLALQAALLRRAGIQQQLGEPARLAADQAPGLGLRSRLLQIGAHDAALR